MSHFSECVKSSLREILLLFSCSLLLCRRELYQPLVVYLLSNFFDI